MQRKVSESALSAARATKMTQRESRVAWQLWLGMVLFLASSVASVGVAQTALGGLFWDCQTNGSDGGHASTQAQAVENWLARMNGFFYAGPCGALGTSQYRNCPIYNGGTSQGSMDVPLICPYGGASPDGLTCPPEYFVTTDSVATADCGCNANAVGEPISLGNGNVSLQQEDVPAPTGVPQGAFARFYNSASPIISDLVTGWTHSFSRRIIPVYQQAPFQLFVASNPRNSPLYSDIGSACSQGWEQVKSTSPLLASTTASYANGVCSLSQNGAVVGTVTVRNASPLPIGITGTPVGFDAVRDDGQRVSFALGGSTLVPPQGSILSLAQTSGGFRLVDGDDNTESYDAAGKLLSVTARSGVTETVAYNSNNLISTITDSFGHVLTLTYDSQNRLSTVSDQNSHSVQYAYDGQTRLQQVTNLDGTSRTYAYESTSAPYLLTGVVDELSNRYSTWQYDGNNRGSVSYEGGTAQDDYVQLTYNNDGSVTYTDALGAVRTVNFQQIGNQNRVVSISGSQCPTCEEPAATTYDAAGFVSSRTDYNGNVTCYANDPSRGLELVRVEGFASGSACPANLSAYTPAAGTTQRKIATTWHPTFRLPATITEATRTTSFGYDASGNLLQLTVTDTTVSPNVSRTWSYTYNGYGQALTSKGPRTDVNSTTTYSYYSCASGAQCGQVQTATDALGHMWTCNTYNAYGQPLTITDPNGVVTTLTYDARQRLTSRTTAGETMSFVYYPTGLLKNVTLPDSSALTYTYDGAHRLTQISDSLGNKIVYTLDGMGNRTATNSYDPSGNLHLTHTRVYNALSELYQDVNAANTAAVTTTYGYDSNGNRTSIAAPLSRNTSKQYDALNRLIQITDPGNGVTQFSYDANNELTLVRDPRALSTTYVNDGFGEVTKLVSPDTGTTNYSYDSAGNLFTSTDARGAVGTYTYDALNRVTQIAYSDQTINYTYDAGTNGIGRLTGASDANHSMSWTYDALGRVTGKSQTVASITRSVGYGYSNGDMVSMVTPSGQTITYGYTNHRITSIKVNGTTLLSGVTYNPFGPATGWTWGNGTTVSRSFDEDGNPQQIVTAGVTNGYAVDNASRITGISDSGLSSASFTYGYDVLDRVTSGVSTSITRGYTYDADGNILTATGSATINATMSPTSNRIASLSGSPNNRTYYYDAAGNTTAFTGSNYAFNQRGFMSSRTVSTGSTYYIHNALGQFINRTGVGGVIILMYDEAGHIIGDYTSTGALNDETVWMDDTPVATLRPNGTSVSIYYVHTDHLGTPRKVTRPSDNVLMWRWDPDTFGSLAANANPSGQGTFVYNLRFPGQFYMAESAGHYNGHRMYDPYVDRYWQSDPIGLAGGLNTYAYAGGSPIYFSDPSGLAYQSPEQAAVAALCNIYWLSWVTNTEYAGRIISVDGGYDFTPAGGKGDDSNNTFSIPSFVTTEQHMFLGFIPYTTTTYTPGAGTVGWYHSHGAPGNGDESYSQADADINSKFNLPGWYVDGNGVVRRGAKHKGVGNRVGDCNCKK